MVARTRVAPRKFDYAALAVFDGEIWPGHVFEATAADWLGVAMGRYAGGYAIGATPFKGRTPHDSGPNTGNPITVAAIKEGHVRFAERQTEIGGITYVPLTPTQQDKVRECIRTAAAGGFESMIKGPTTPEQSQKLREAIFGRGYDG